MQRTHKDTAARYWITATAELSWHRGNAKPYFSLTADGKDCGSEFGGCCHEEILKHWPDLQPLAALHLSDIDGVPMHGVSNGWYWLAGAMGGAGERYHGGADKSADECLRIFASHCRISLDEANALMADVQRKWNYPDMKARCAELLETMKPRWLAEANTAIEQFQLQRPAIAT